MSLKTPSTTLLGTGRAVPERVLTNHDLEQMVDTNDEWITSRTGIKERHIAEEGLTTSELCARAAEIALQDAGIKADQLDAILLGTVSGDATFPSTACYVQEKIGAQNAVAIDMQAACSGFLYVSDFADSMIATGKAKYVLAIGGELLSRLIDWTDRSTCILFGDGAGAAVYGPANGDGSGIIDSYMKSDGRLTDLLCMVAGGTNISMEQAVAKRDLRFLTMQGPEVFKAAVTSMGDAAVHILEANKLTGGDLDLVIPHQANVRIMKATARRIKLPMEKLYVNVDRFGNTSAASIPIALDEARRNGHVNKGDLVMMVAFGGGFTWGSLLMRM